jgi:hypothetical protein
LGARQYWEVSQATLSGERISASLAMPGGDWMAVSDDGFWRPDVRAQFRTSDGATILMRYTGLVEQSSAFKEAAAETARHPGRTSTCAWRSRSRRETSATNG